MKKRLLILPLSFLLHFTHFGQKTWSEHIAPIIYKNCTGCHHKGGAAPFSLMTYKEVEPYKTAIHHAVSTGHMPPWPPDVKYNQFAFQRALNDADKQAILDWVDQGAKEGDASKTPAAPVYNNEPVVTNAGFVQRIPKYTISGNRDDYRCFPIKSGVTADKFITAMECIPGNGSVVHHVLVFQDQANTCFDLDARDSKPGYQSFGGVGSNSATLIGGWVPGSQPNILPKGMGIRLKANANIIIQVHYAPGSDGASDSTQLRFRVSDGPMREVFAAPILNHSLSLTNGPLYIPANTTKTFYSQYTILGDATIISIAPHMHYIGKGIKSWAITPTNDTIKLINIPDWDFHWQGSYLFKKAIKLPRFTRLFGEAFYDNRATNLNNPSTPPKDVSLGEGTTDEMMLIYFTFLAYQAGDENIDLEKAVLATDTEEQYPLGKTALECYPNPANQHLTLRFNLEKEEKLDIQIFDYQGIMVKNILTGQSFNSGKNEKSVPINDLPTGAYLITVRSKNIYGVQSFIKH